MVVFSHQKLVISRPPLQNYQMGMQSDSDMRGAPLDLECFFNLLFNWLGSCNVGHTTMPHSIQYHGGWRLQLVRFIISAHCPKSIALLVCRDVRTKRYFLDTSRTWRKIQQPRKKHCFVFSLLQWWMKASQRQWCSNPFDIINDVACLKQ